MSQSKTAVLVVNREDGAKKTRNGLATLSLLTLSLVGVYAMLHTFFL